VVGGIEDKAVAAERKDADVFLVPEDEVELASESGLEVLGVGTLEEAIEALRS
jgi:predicted S18 family serine protease